MEFSSGLTCKKMKKHIKFCLFGYRTAVGALPKFKIDAKNTDLRRLCYSVICFVISNFIARL